ncbi:MAG: hypothetical protein LWW87_13585, partial [Geobacteraceae bacterium]|nr:hypothetical protein [Geobacteraceae bacterium]
PGKTIKFDKASLDDDATKNQFDKATLIFELEQKRRDTLTDKVKTLLNLGTFLLTFSVALFNLIKVQSSLYPIIIIFSLAAIICILQCLSFLSMNSISVPAFESNNNDDELETYDISKEYALPDHIEELVTCCDYNHRGNDFLADV